MKIQKDKTYPDLLSSTKEHLKIFSGDTTYDSEITALIQVAITQIENDIDFNIVPTRTLITSYKQCGQYYRIDEPSISLSGITGTTELGEVTIIPVSACTQYGYQQYTDIKFPTSYTFETLIIYYGSGFPTLPAPLTHAVKLLVQVLFDGSSDNEKELKTYSRLISFYRNILQ